MWFQGSWVRAPSFTPLFVGEYAGNAAGHILFFYCPEPGNPGGARSQSQEVETFLHTNPGSPATNGWSGQGPFSNRTLSSQKKDMDFSQKGCDLFIKRQHPFCESFLVILNSHRTSIGIITNLLPMLYTDRRSKAAHCI